MSKNKDKDLRKQTICEKALNSEALLGHLKGDKSNNQSSQNDDNPSQPQSSNKDESRK